MILDYSKLQLFGIEMIFVDFKNYQNLIETFLNDKRVELEKDFDKDDLTKTIDLNSESNQLYRDHLLDQFSERHREISVIFPHSFRVSLLTQIVSFIEFELKEICDFYGSKLGETFRLQDLKGNSDFEKAKTYLVKTAKINFDNLNPEWLFIDNCRQLRNKLVHNQGYIMSSDAQIMTFIKGLDSIILNDAAFAGEQAQVIIIQNRTLIDRLIELAESFFKKLLYTELKYGS